MKSPLRVAILAQLLPGRAGGIESNLLELLRHLAPMDAVVRPTVIGPGDQSGWLRAHVAAGGEILPWPPIRYVVEDSWIARVRAPMPRRVAIILRRAWLRLLPAMAIPGHHVASGRMLSDLLRARGVEVLHCPYQRYFETDLPLIFEPWDLQHMHCPENFSAQEIRFRNHLYAEACTRAALVVVPTFWGKRDLTANLGIDAHRIAVIRRGPGRLDRPDPHLTSDLSPNLPYAVYPAKFWPHKNHLRLFEALALLRANGCVVPLVCTGDPPAALPADLRDAIARLGLESQVRFLGHLERGALGAVLSRARLMVFPSKFEGYGIPVVEAMALGVPVSCSRIGPLEELAGDAAELFDPDDASAIATGIERVWNAETRRRELIEEGARGVQALDWQQAANDFVLCYRHVAGHTLDDIRQARFERLLRDS
jgi:glycosyltransferase involved in cell wall biosynthesis